MFDQNHMNQEYDDGDDDDHNDGDDDKNNDDEGVSKDNILIQGVAGALVKAVEMDSKVKGEEVDDDDEFADRCVVE